MSFNVVLCQFDLQAFNFLTYSLNLLHKVQLEVKMY